MANRQLADSIVRDKSHPLYVPIYNYLMHKKCYTMSRSTVKFAINFKRFRHIIGFLDIKLMRVKTKLEKFATSFHVLTARLRQRAFHGIRRP